MKKQRLSLSLANQTSIIVEPLDIYTENKAEFLRFRNSQGQEQSIRLDKIVSFEFNPI